MKVKFCSHGYATMIDKFDKVPINPAWLFIQKWYELHGLNPNIQWLMPGVVVLDDPETIVNNIVNESPDILGLGFYIWNQDLQYYIAENVKKLKPNVIIVGGGPQLSAHHTKDTEDQSDFFVKYPFFDYVCYGDGEKAMQQIIDYCSGYLTDKNSFVNIVENVSGQRKIYPYEMIADHTYLSTSPFLSQEQHMTDIRDYFASRGITNDKQSWTVEFARGCMYSCTFCDWGQNLTKKVKRRTHSWKEDIDLFRRLDVAIRESDANFGQWQEDIEAYDYARSLYDPARSFQFAPINTPKLKKEATQHIMINNSLTYGLTPKISLQDVNEDVLSAIDRPNISWEKLTDLVSNMKKQLPPEQFKKLQIESMIALPGQSLDSVVETMLRLFEIEVLHHTWTPWVMLPNSPGASLTYRKLWGVQVKDVYRRFSDEYVEVADLETIYQELSQTTKHLGLYGKLSGVVATKTMPLHHIWAAIKLNNKWQDLINHVDIFKYSSEQVKNFLIRLKNKSLAEAEEQMKLHQPLIDKYQCVVWSNYDVDSKKITENF